MRYTMRTLCTACAALVGCGGDSSDDSTDGSELEEDSEERGDSDDGDSDDGDSDETADADDGDADEQDDRPSPPEAAPPGDWLPAFPGAEGFGTETPGGRGGRVYVVSTLDWDGPGSFYEALMAEEPRIIVFAVSGVIEVGQTAMLEEQHSFVTIAGQTSPGGITFVGEVMTNYHTNFHDAVFRHLRFRGNGNYDNVSFSEAHHLVFDHCDFSGATDETFDVTSAHDVTVQWSTITNSESGEGAQNYGSLFAYNPTTRFSIHHNLHANHGGRCLAQFHWAGGVPPEGVVIEMRNNVIYNCGFDAAVYSDVPDEGTERMAFNVVGNLMLSGPSSPENQMMFALPSGAQLYARDNVVPGGEVLSPFRELVTLDEPAEAPKVLTHGADEGLELVLGYAGAFPRDPMNTRVVTEVRDGTGALGRIDDALIESGPEAPADRDGDGMPDEWEAERELDPDDSGDASADRDDDGYTNIEEYINERAEAITL